MMERSGIRFRRVTAGTLALMLAGAATGAPVVKVDGGALAGVAADGGVAFLGVPYAAAPLGHLRWRPPGPVAHWAGTRQADHYGASCVQPASQREPANQQSEDCLFLNIWVPADAAGQKLPVLFNIHGGGYTEGSGKLADTSAFLRDHVIVVSINYRLGRVGQFAHPALTAENPKGPLGSYTTMDQVAALRWVANNIGAFGGDPHKVTLFGCSAGGTYVDLLMGTPSARGLFRGAMALSDPFNQPWPRLQRMGPDPSGSAEDYGVRFADSVGLPHATAAQLRALPVDKLIAPPADSPLLRIQPIVDGQFVAEQGKVFFEKGALAHVPYVNLTNSWEGSLGRGYAQGGRMILRNIGPGRDAVLALYPADVRNDPERLAGEVMDDISFHAGQRTALNAATRNGLPAWGLYFDYVGEGARGPAVPGAPHCAQMAYGFETPSAVAPHAAPTAADMKVAKAMHGYIVNFVKTGNPNGPGLPAWPHYGPQQAMMMVRAGGIAPENDPDAERMKTFVKASETMSTGIGEVKP